MEIRPIPTLRAFLASEFSYALPAPGGALKDGGIRTDAMGDAYMASLAAKAKKRLADKRDVREYLTQHATIIANQMIFDTKTDTLILKRIAAWLKEFSH